MGLLTVGGPPNRNTPYHMHGFINRLWGLMMKRPPLKKSNGLHLVLGLVSRRGMDPESLSQERVMNPPTSLLIYHLGLIWALSPPPPSPPAPMIIVGAPPKVNNPHQNQGQPHINKHGFIHRGCSLRGPGPQRRVASTGETGASWLTKPWLQPTRTLKLPT